MDLESTNRSDRIRIRISLQNQLHDGNSQVNVSLIGLHSPACELSPFPNESPTLLVVWHEHFQICARLLRVPADQSVEMVIVTLRRGIRCHFLNLLNVKGF